jgi:hypothetical protein
MQSLKIKTVSTVFINKKKPSPGLETVTPRVLNQGLISANHPLNQVNITSA